MSNPVRAPADPTRQQLADLDALLERMLALPVNQLEENTGHGDTSFASSGPDSPLAGPHLTALEPSPYTSWEREEQRVDEEDLGEAKNSMPAWTLQPTPRGYEAEESAPAPATEPELAREPEALAPFA